MIENIEGTTINIRIQDEEIALPNEIKRKIEEFWNKCKTENPNLWNGELMCVGEYKKEGKEIEIVCKKTNYAHYLYDERIGLSKEYACSSLVAGCLIETSDNYYIVGELADNTSFPHCMQISGGSADNNDIKDGKIEPIECVKLFAYFSYFIEKNLIDYDIKTMESVFTNGMNIASVTSEYCADAKEELEQIAIENPGEEMQRIIKRFYEINTQLKDRMYTEKTEELFKCIPMKMEVFYDKYAKECKDIPIFKYYDPFQLFQRLSCASNEDMVTIREMLAERAKQNSDLIKLEIENMRKLKMIMDNYIDGKRPTIKTVMIEEFAKELGNVVDKYKNTTVD